MVRLTVPAATIRKYHGRPGSVAASNASRALPELTELTVLTVQTRVAPVGSCMLQGVTLEDRHQNNDSRSLEPHEVYNNSCRLSRPPVGLRAL